MLVIDHDLASFMRKTLPLLEKQPSLHSLLISFMKRYSDLQKPVSLMVSSDKMIGLQTEDLRPIMISLSTAEEASFFAEEIFKKGFSLPGVNGPLPGADAFAKRWEKLSSHSLQLGVDLRLFELKHLISTPKPSGNWRLAQERDENLVLDWIKAFHDEAVPQDPLASDDEILKMIRINLKAKNYYLWEDQGVNVCFVASSRETERERWIGPVYTPKICRGKGYGSALVAEVSSQILSQGKVAMLFTDLANPVSNSIYQKMGYKALGDFRHWIFKPQD